MRDVLRWLSVSQRISYGIAALVFCYLSGCAHLTYVISVARYLTLLLVGCLALGPGDPLVPGSRPSAMQNRDFPVVGPSTWNGLPPQLRLLPSTIYLRSKSHLSLFSSAVGFWLVRYLAAILEGRYKMSSVYVWSFKNAKFLRLFFNLSILLLHSCVLSVCLSVDHLFYRYTRKLTDVPESQIVPYLLPTRFSLLRVLPQQQI